MSQSGIYNPTGGGGGGGGSLVLIGTANVPAGTVFVPFALSNLYTTFMLTFSNVLSSSAQPLIMQFSTNGGLSYITTQYQSGINKNAYNSNAWTNTNRSDSVILTPTANAGTLTANGTIWLYNMNTTTAPYALGQSVASVGGTCTFSFVQGNNATVTPVTAMKILIVGGGTLSGKFSLYGLLQ